MASIETIRWRERKDPETGRKVKYNVPKAQWRYEARWRDPQGKQCHQRFPRKGDAERHLERIGVSIQDGDYVDPKLRRVLFDTWAEAWWRTTVKLAPSTRSGYWQLLRTHVLPYFTGRQVATIDFMDVEEFIADRLEYGANPKRVADMVSIAAMIMDGPMKSKIRRDNPARGHSIPRRRRRLRPGDVLDLRQLLTLIEHVRDPYKPAVWILVLTGIRPSELAGLRVKSIDFQNHAATSSSARSGSFERVSPGDRLSAGRLYVDSALVFVHNYADEKTQLAEGPPKTDAGYRAIDIPAELCDMLAEMLAGRAAERGAPIHQDEYLFTQPKGGPLKTNWFRAQVIVPALFSAGLPLATRTYDLRHSHASILIAQGANVLDVAHRLGHAEPSVTLKVYGHLFKGAQEALTKKLAEEVTAIQAEPPKVVSIDTRRELPAAGETGKRTLAQRRELVAELRAAGQPIRTIALSLGVDTRTIGRDLARLERTRSAQERTKSG